jgi:iron complex outermembrane receptor protein
MLQLRCTRQGARFPRIITEIAICCFLAGVPGGAQQLSISGTVSDPQAVAPGVSVTLRDPAGANRQQTTDDRGRYAFEGLGAGSYELSFKRPGFLIATRSLSLATDARTVDVVLSLAGVSTTLDVIDVAGKATSSRMEIPDIEIPVQVSTIPEQVIEQQGANDLVTVLRNASGVSAQLFYGAYEYYTIRGFHESDVLLVDGLRLEGNRFDTQLNNVQEVEVLKGPSSILYGGGALSGVINIIRKKPQGNQAYDLFYRGGRFNTQQVGGGATGPLFSDKLLYRLDASYNHADGWRNAGSNRLDVAPTLTWLINSRARVSVFQTFNRDNFKGDGGVPIEITTLPGYDPNRRFSTPSDFVREHDSLTQVLLNVSLSSSWELRDGFQYRRANDEYFVTEGLTYDPDLNEIDRYALYFKHHRRPMLNQADLVGRLKFLGMRHVLMAGYEYEDFYNFTNRTDDGGDHFPPPISLVALQETQAPITSFPIAEVDHSSNRTNAFYWQDQISIGEHLSLNVGGRLDGYRRLTHVDTWDDNGSLTDRGPDKRLNQTAYTYRAGLVYALPASQQVYFSSASSFQPVTILPAGGKQLNPETGRSYEFGYRWQGFNRRIQTSLAFYNIKRNDVVIQVGPGLYDQAGQQSAKGIDFDLNGDLGHGTRLIVNYGYSSPRFDDYVSGGDVLTGNRPRFTQRHAANAWLTKSWKQGLTAGAGVRYLSSVFTDDSDAIRVGGWTTFSGFASYRRGVMEYSLNAENLLNRNRYFLGSDYDDQVYPGAPINVFATIRFRFR